MASKNFGDTNFGPPLKSLEFQQLSYFRHDGQGLKIYQMVLKGSMVIYPMTFLHFFCHNLQSCESC